MTLREQVQTISSETRLQRIQAEFNRIADARPLDDRYTEEQNRQLMIMDAQHRVDKAMLEEVHLMLRFLVEKANG